MKHKLTRKNLEKLKACETGLKYFDENFTGDVETFTAQLAKDHPEHYLWLVGRNFDVPVDADTIRECALKTRGSALVRCADKLDADTLRECALKSPWAALEFCPHLLDDKTIKRCAILCPRKALWYCKDRLDIAMIQQLEGMR